jgi:hypothetical protein
MDAVPPIVGHGEFDAVVVRTDYEDEEAWQVVLKALAEPWGDGEFEALAHIVDDPAWSGADGAAAIGAIIPQPGPSVVFLADRETMQAGHHALLAVNAVSREELGEEEYGFMTEYGCEFRTVPVGVHGVHANLQLGNMGFEEFAEAARDDPEGVYRSF